MKKLITLVVLCIGTLAFSQDKNAKSSIEVDGICGMCKARIEKAAIKTKGVKSAIWNVDTHELKLIYDARKTSVDSIAKNIAAVGHDTKAYKAKDEVYEKINPCCLYRDQAVVKAHN